MIIKRTHGFKKPPATARYSTATEWGNSRWTCLRACYRRYYLIYILGLEPVRPRRGLDRGTATHAGWEAFHRGKSRSQVLEIVEAAAIERDARDQAIRMIDWYMDVYPKSAVRLINGAEVHHRAEFDVTIGNRRVIVPLTTRYDLLGVPRGENEVRWVDLKTQGSFKADRLLRYLADPQLMQGVAIWDEAGCPNGIRSGKSYKIPKHLTPQIFVIYEKSKGEIGMRTVDVYVTEWQVKSIVQSRAFEAAFVLPALQECYGIDEPWPHEWGACFNQYGACEFYDYCHTNGAARDMYYRKEDHKPLLLDAATEVKRES
ncbi:MAG: PD-(D/E)XK nuclease family protein [Pseudomonadota bacterium]